MLSYCEFRENRLLSGEEKFQKITTHKGEAVT